MFWPVTIDPLHTIVSNNGIFAADIFQSLWNLWWTPYALFSLHSNFYFTKFLFYPVGANLVTETLTPLAGILFSPFQSVGLIFEYNLIFISSFALSGLFMFMLADHFVKNRYASFIAGMIYAFSPMHIAQSYVHLDWTVIEFIPLFILFFILSIEKRNFKYKVFAAVSFLLLTFFGDILQGVIVTVFVILFFFYIIVKKRKEIGLKNLTMDIAMIYLLILIIGLPFFIEIFHSVVYSNSLGETVGQTGIYTSVVPSDNLLSFFLPSWFNMIFSNFSLKYYYSQVFSPNINEKVSYIGYSVLALMSMAFIFKKKESALKDLGLWLFILVAFALIALGPIIQVGSVYVLYGPYVFYHSIPLFNIVREPGKFDVIVTVSAAILAAIGFARFEEFLVKKKKSRTAVSLMAMCFVFAIFMEYNGMPSLASAGFLFMKPQIPSVYYNMTNGSGGGAVLMLPDVPDDKFGQLYQGLEMYFQTGFKKPIFGGYTSRQNTTQDFSQDFVPLSTQAGLLENGDIYFLNYSYPVQENYSYADLWLAKEYNISYISVIKDAYMPLEYGILSGYISTIFGKPLYDNNYTIVFSTRDAVEGTNYSYPVVYVDGEWSIENKVWAAYNSSSISVYTGNSSQATLNVSIFSPTNTTAYECLNGMPVSKLNLTVLNQYHAITVNATNKTGTLTFSKTDQCNEDLVWDSYGITLK